MTVYSNTKEAKVEFKWLHHKGEAMRSLENVLAYQPHEVLGVYLEPYPFKLGKVAETPGFERVPDTYELLQNHPNPMTDHTFFYYHLPEAGEIELSIYDLHGHKVMTIDQGRKEAGSYEIRWDGLAPHGAQLPSGMYIYILDVNGHRLVKHLVK